MLQPLSEDLFYGIMNRPSFHSAWLHWSVFIFAILAVVSRAWVAEDAYITFRAVENLYGGYGLVFNPGERTEVFTHPLWMIVLVIIKGSGLALHFGSIITGILLASLTFYILIFRPFDRDSRSYIHIFPAAALILAGNSGIRDFATAGMEFTLVFFLFTLFSEVILNRSDSDNDPQGRKKASFFSSGLFQKPFAASTILILLYLTRPELALLYIYYSFFMFIFLVREFAKRKNDKSASGKYTDVFITGFLWSAPLFLFAGLYHLFRYLYFDDIFPNTYYAKSGLSSYYVQGLKYLLYTILWSPGLWIYMAITAVWITVNLLKNFNNQAKDVVRLRYFPVYVRTADRSFFLGVLRDLGAVLILVFYVVKIGGDFMSFRFLLPEIAFFILIAKRISENSFEIDKNYSEYLKIPVAALLMLLIFWPVPLYKGYVADERRMYTEHGNTGQLERFFKENFPWGEKAYAYKNLQSCLGYSPFWISNSQAQARCMEGVGLGYFGVNAGPHVLIFDEQGLPNKEVSRARIFTRFRPGHERYLTPSQIIEKGVLFCSSGEPDYDYVMHTEFGVLISFDPEIFLTLPNAKERIEALLKLKKQGSEIIPLLEERYGITLEQMKKLNSEVKFDGRENCWR